MEEIYTDKAPKPIGPYSQATRAGPFVFVSGQIAVDPSEGVLVGATIELQTDRVLRNIGAILREAGLGLEHVIKTEIFLKNFDHFHGMNEVYSRFFQQDVKPARVTVQVSMLPLNGLIEISCIAYG